MDDYDLLVGEAGKLAAALATISEEYEKGTLLGRLLRKHLRPLFEEGNSPIQYVGGVLVIQSTHFDKHPEEQEAEAAPIMEHSEEPETRAVPLFKHLKGQLAIIAPELNENDLEDVLKAILYPKLESFPNIPIDFMRSLRHMQCHLAGRRMDMETPKPKGKDAKWFCSFFAIDMFLVHMVSAEFLEKLKIRWNGAIYEWFEKLGGRYPVVLLIIFKL